MVDRDDMSRTESMTQVSSGQWPGTPVRGPAQGLSWPAAAPGSPAATRRVAARLKVAKLYSEASDAGPGRTTTSGLPKFRHFESLNVESLVLIIRSFVAKFQVCVEIVE